MKQEGAIECSVLEWDSIITGFQNEPLLATCRADCKQEVPGDKNHRLGRAWRPDQSSADKVEKRMAYREDAHSWVGGGQWGDERRCLQCRGGGRCHAPREEGEGFGRVEAQALGEDQSKINEQPRGLAVGLEGPGSSLMGDGVQGILGTMEAPAAPWRSQQLPHTPQAPVHRA